MDELVITEKSAAPAMFLPALIADAGEVAAVRYLEFFTVTIRNPHTRAAYRHAARAFLGWCELGGIRELRHVQPIHVAAYIEWLGLPVLKGGAGRSPPTVKQHLACIRMLFDWLVVGQVLAQNPAHAVKGPRYSMDKGKTPVVASDDVTKLLAGIATVRTVKGKDGVEKDVADLVGLRDRAVIAVMTYTFARVGAVVALSVEDYFVQKQHWCVRLHEKNGKVNDMPAHSRLSEHLADYIEAAGIGNDRKGPLFRSAVGWSGKLGPRAMSRKDVWRMVRRRAAEAGFQTLIGCHTFCATGITDYLSNKGFLEVAQRMAGHSNAKTTGLYDRRADIVSVREVEKIGI